MDGVLVVGAGPVGLTMAAELARHGTRCRIIDRLAQPLPYAAPSASRRARSRCGRTWGSRAR